MFNSKPALFAGREISVSPASTFDSCLVPATRTKAPAVAGTFPRSFTVILLMFLVLTRWMVAPQHLYYFDSANFALSLEEFNPALHQPQPPGYPLFVGLMRVIHLVVEAPEQVMLVAGLLGGAAAVLLLLTLATEMFGRPAGILSAALLASDPVFWFGGVTNEIRIFLSFGILLVCLMAWRALTNPHRPAWLFGLFAALGVAAGFRPIETWLLLPLALWIWYRCGHSARRLAVAMGALAGTTLPWLGYTVWKVGGVTRFVNTLNDYADSQFQGSSALFGATPPAAWHMALMAIGWTLLGAVVWVWAIPFMEWRREFPGWRTAGPFLALAFFPPFLFAVFVHVGDPDQTLAGVSVLSLAGGAVIGRLLGKAPVSRIYMAAALLAAVHCSTFYHPPYHLAEAASYSSVRNVDRMTNETIAALDTLRAAGPLTIVHYGSTVTSRQIAYYYPEDYVNILPGGPGQAAPGETPFTFFRHHAIAVPPNASGIIRSGSQRLVWLPPNDAAALPGWRKVGPLYELENIPQKGVQIGDYRLIWQNP